eukprot:SAG22_NODE_2395_length_2620_cov_1.102737_4_plen_133_part_00
MALLAPLAQVPLSALALAAEHEEVAEQTLWVEHCAPELGGDGSLLLHSRGISRWAEHVPRFLWGYTRMRYRQGHLALRRQLLKRARQARAAGGGAEERRKGCTLERAYLPTSGSSDDQQLQDGMGGLAQRSP